MHWRALTIYQYCSAKIIEFIRHKGSASTIQNIQYIHILENENTRTKNYKKWKKWWLKCWDTGKNGSVACCVVSSLHAVCKFMISVVVWWCWSAESLWIWQWWLLSSVSNVTHRTVLSVCLPDRSAPPCRQQILCWWLVSMLSYLSSARFSKSNPRTSGFGKLFTPIVPLFTKHQNW